MSGNIANRKEKDLDKWIVKKVLGRTTEAIRRLLDEGLDFDHFQKIIDSPRFRKRLVEYAKADTPDTEINIICIGVNADTPLQYDKRKEDWKIKKETSVRSGAVVLKLVECTEKAETINSEELIQRAEKHNPLGQHYAEALLKSQEVIPYKYRGSCLAFPGHVWKNIGSAYPGLCIPCLAWAGECWQLEFFSFGFVHKTLFACSL